MQRIIKIGGLQLLNQYNVEFNSSRLIKNTNVIPILIVQSLKGLSKYFKKDKCTQINRSCTSPTLKQNIARKNSNQLLNFVNSNENRPVPNLFENVQRQNINAPVCQNATKGRILLIVMNILSQEDSKSKYLQLKETLNQRITSLELEFEKSYAIEKNAKNIVDQTDNYNHIGIEQERLKQIQNSRISKQKNQQLITINSRQQQIMKKNKLIDLRRQYLKSQKQPFITSAMKQIIHKQIIKFIHHSVKIYRQFRHRWWK
ncbi:unnamed protein product (macronuclear) [Paramecium tetraurelia]|uniref:Uncharacterized protein n=1 Tax=Paramecium tetraurelia TaxID=5888 RepID=A0DPX3_PARTE|nr:uncharacterized protein GSPATT00002489001 [Paramecium tetraurelia]CAK85090.1 unnamed protein product [Paramecium tetraurelia]|eukprot:XP_001452487.1 hypothetical protein (macronuclear) [Paramecium tetraurelia strain d4-2]